MDKTLVGRKVRLIKCTDKFTELAPGTTGTVQTVDSLGTLHVAWDDGSQLGLVEDAGDRWKLLPR